jgi:molybdate transport system substrate-binding protein
MRSFLTTTIFLLILGSTALGAEIRLSAAASMTDAVKALTTHYKESNPNVTFQTNFASSGILAQQISLGAPTDFFISANTKWMDYLITERYISTDSVTTLAGNSLVFIGRKELPIATMTALVQLERIAIGSPKSVPAGQYAVQALKTAGLYDRLQGKLVMAKDARQALVYADRGETDGAFVYKTDALLAQEAIILLEVPQALYTEITYPVGITTTGSANREAVAFFDFLKTETARSILKAHGFELNQIRQQRTGDSH